MRPKVLALILVFVSLSIGLAIFLPRTSPKLPPICPVHALLHADGSVEFGGAVFTSLEKFKARLVSYKTENPGCFLSTVSDGSVPQEVVLRVGNVMLEAGFSSVDFLTEPHSLAH